MAVFVVLGRKWRFFKGRCLTFFLAKEVGIKANIFSSFSCYGNVGCFAVGKHRLLWCGRS